MDTLLKALPACLSLDECHLAKILFLYTDISKVEITSTQPTLEKSEQPGMVSSVNMATGLRELLAIATLNQPRIQFLSTATGSHKGITISTPLTQQR